MGLTSPEELFDINIFKDDPRPFYKFVKQSSFFSTGTNDKGAIIQPSASHLFLAWLEQTNRLLRVYTQNIDGLEEAAGVSPNRVVYAHGSLRWAQCMKCRAKLNTSELLDDVMANKVPLCKEIIFKKNKSNNYNFAQTKISIGEAKLDQEIPSREAKGYKLRRRNPRNNKINDSSSWEAEHTAYIKKMNINGIHNHCGGVMKPGVTFFGEKLKDQVTKCMEKDYAKVDALLVMGTSLSVTPMSKMIHYFPPSIPRILINQTIVQPPNISMKEGGQKNVPSGLDDKNHNKDFRNGYTFDACLLGFCDDITTYIWNSLAPFTNNDEHYKKKRKLKNDQTNIISRLIPTENLENKLLCNIIQSETMNRHVNYEGGKFSDINGTCNNNDNCIDGDNQYEVYNHPTNRVFVFQGAIMNKKKNCDDNKPEFVQREVALCDGCEEEIVGSIMKCSVCFDYDLCLKCFPTVSKKHFGGKHKFMTEEQGCL